jgi:hypothetical protein
VFVWLCRPNVLTGSLPPKLLFACARYFVRVRKGENDTKDILEMGRVFFLWRVFPTSCPLVQVEGQSCGFSEHFFFEHFCALSGY